MQLIVKKIRKELRASADVKTRASFQRFFKEPVKYHGVKTGIVGKIAAKHWKEIRHLPKKEIFAICEELFESDYTEEAFVVSFWGHRFNSFTEKDDLAVFEKWIDKYINNWAKCDGFCNHTVGDFAEKFPGSIARIKSWAKSKNRWMRRAAAASLIIPAKRGKLLKDVFEIADELLLDSEDMVQKGYGWLLKEASRKHQKEVFEFVMKRKASMPRTALRYAIELMPKTLRQRAMGKD